MPNHIHTAEIVHLKPAKPRKLDPDLIDLDARAIGVLVNLSDIEDVTNVKYVVQRALVLIESYFEEGKPFAEAMTTPIA
jgi:hypothetical protein